MSPSLNVFINATKAFGNATKAFGRAPKAFSHASKASNKSSVKGRCSENGMFTILLVDFLFCSCLDTTKTVPNVGRRFI